MAAKLLCILLLLSFSAGLSAQPADSTAVYGDSIAVLQPLPDLPDGLQRIWRDATNAVYYLDKSGTLYKQDAASTFVFADTRLGTLTDLDVSNPFGLLAWFADYQLIVLLDRTLHERGRLDLREIDATSNTSLVARSADDRIWVYDEYEFRLRLLDQSGREQLRSDDLRQLLRITESPLAILPAEGAVFVYFPTHGLVEFSRYGRYRATRPLPAADKFSWTGGELLLRSGNQLRRWRPISGLTDPLTISAELLDAEWILPGPSRFLVSRRGKAYWWEQGLRE
ncbi:MAG: hypothetical protein WBA17_09640 [Saprospiraceae bacterium]